MFKQSSRHLHNESGMGLLELLVASALGMIVAAMAYGVLVLHQRNVIDDVHRTRLSQNLRAVMDFLAVDIRQAGEQLPAIFPSIILQNGTSGGTDTLILRRNIISEPLTVCANLNNGTTVTTISLNSTASGTPPVCVYGGQTTALSKWSQYRADKGGSFKAYIFNTSTKKGQFITVTSTTNSGSTMSLGISSAVMTESYPRNTSVLYALEEWKYSVNADKFLSIVENEESSSEKFIAFDIEDFQVTIKLKSGSSLTTFDTTNNWGDISAIQIVVSGETSTGKKTFSDSLSSEFLPRNILSL